jgi:hypothetical protein
MWVTKYKNGMPDVVITGLNKVDVKIHNVTYISILLQSHSCLSIIHLLYSPQANFVKNVYFEKHENTLSKPWISSCDPSWKSCLCGCRNSDKSSRATAKKCKDEKPLPDPPLILYFNFNEQTYTQTCW